MVIGAILMLVAAIGMCRVPDVPTRMQTATKAGTLGIGCLMTAVGLPTTTTWGTTVTQSSSQCSSGMSC